MTQASAAGLRQGCRLPAWVSVQPLSGTLAPQATATIHFSSLLSERSQQPLTVRQKDGRVGSRVLIQSTLLRGSDIAPVQHET